MTRKPRQEWIRVRLILPFQGSRLADLTVASKQDDIRVCCEGWVELTICSMPLLDPEFSG